MGKRPLTLRVRIPPYCHPRNEWRRAIHAELIKAASARQIKYTETDRLDLIITLYLSDDKIGWHDVDNRLKDVMDALQGRAGGPKTEHRLRVLVPNDHQIHRVMIEKIVAPQQSLGMGHLIIRKHKEGTNTALHGTVSCRP